MTQPDYHTTKFWSDILLSAEQTTTPFDGKRHQVVATFQDMIITVKWPIKNYPQTLYFVVRTKGRHKIKFNLLLKRPYPIIVIPSRKKKKPVLDTVLLPIKNTFVRKTVGLIVDDFKVKLYGKLTYEQFEDDLTIIKLLTSK